VERGRTTRRVLGSVEVERSELGAAESTRRNLQAIRSTIFGVTKRRESIVKGEGATPATGVGVSAGHSMAREVDPFVRLEKSGKILRPPFDPLLLAVLPENSTEVGPAVDAMAVNCEGFGWRLDPRIPVTEATPVEILEALARERVAAENFFAGACQDENGFDDLRDKLRRDFETTGMFYVEFLETPGVGDLDGLNHLPSWTMRLGRLDHDRTEYVARRVVKDVRLVSIPSQVDVPEVGPDLVPGEGDVEGREAIRKQRYEEQVSYEIVEETRWKRFRRYVQKHEGSTTWFKELGDPRLIDCRNGEVVDREKLVESHGDGAKVEPRFTLAGDAIVVAEGTSGFPVRLAANPVKHLDLYSTRSSYGLPRYIGNLFSIFGSRAADEINYVTFKNQNVPNLVVSVSNGQLTQESADRIEEFLETIQSDDNYSKILLLEAEPVMEGMRDPGTVRIEIKPLTKEQHADALFVNYQNNNDERTRRSWRFPPIFVGKCHSDDTEFLTESGWKRFDDVLPNDVLGTQSPDGSLEYQEPSARHAYEYDGELLHLKNRGVDALVTPNHRMKVRALSAPDRTTKDWDLVEAADLASIRGRVDGRVEVPVSAKWDGEERATFTIPPNLRKNARDPDAPSNNARRDCERRERWLRENDAREVSMDAFLRFLGYFVSEGSTTESRGPLGIGQNRGAVAEKILAAFREIGFCDPTVVEGRPGELGISVSHVGLWEWLRENCGRNSAEKRVPTWLLGLSRRQLKIFLDCYVEGDGSRPLLGSVGSFGSSTVSSKLSDQLQEICFKLGMASTVRVEEPTLANCQCKYVLYAHFDESHSVKVEGQISRVTYRGRVVCFSVPNGTLVTRRGGRILVSGNSEDFTGKTIDASRRLGDEQVFGPERHRFDRFWTRWILVEGLGIVWSTFRSNSPDVAENADLVKLMAQGEKTGGLTPRIARQIIGRVVNTDLGEVDSDFLNPDQPFSLTLAQLMKSDSATAAEGGGESTSQGRAGIQVGGGDRDRDAEAGSFEDDAVERLAGMLRAEVAARFGGFVPTSFLDDDLEEEDDE
jgi:capsid portal protein